MPTLDCLFRLRIDSRRKILDNNLKCLSGMHVPMYVCTSLRFQRALAFQLLNNSGLFYHLENTHVRVTDVPVSKKPLHIDDKVTLCLVWSSFCVLFLLSIFMLNEDNVRDCLLHHHLILTSCVVWGGGGGRQPLCKPFSPVTGKPLAPGLSLFLKKQPSISHILRSGAKLC